MTNLMNLLSQLSSKMQTNSPILQEICKILLGNYRDKLYPKLYSLLLERHQINEIIILGIVKYFVFVYIF